MTGALHFDMPPFGVEYCHFVSNKALRRQGLKARINSAQWQSAASPWGLGIGFGFVDLDLWIFIIRDIIIAWIFIVRDIIHCMDFHFPGLCPGLK